MWHSLCSNNDELIVTIRTWSPRFTCTFKSLALIQWQIVSFCHPVHDKNHIGIKKKRQGWINFCFKELRIWERTSKCNPRAPSLLDSKFLCSASSSAGLAGFRAHSASLRCVLCTPSITPFWSLICRLHAQGSGVSGRPARADLNEMETFLSASMCGSLHLGQWSEVIHTTTQKTKRTGYTGKSPIGKTYALLLFKLCLDV